MNGGEAAPTANVQVVALAREGVKVKRKSTTLFKRSMGMEAEFLKGHPVKSTMCEQHAGVVRRMMTLKTRMHKAQLALEK